MEMTRISRRKAGSAPRRVASTLTPLVRADIDPAFRDARRIYLDALHIPAAVIVMEDDHPRLACANSSFEAILKNNIERRSLGGIAQAVKSFVASDRERDDVPWEESGIGGRQYRLHLARLPVFSDPRPRVMLSLVDRTAELENERSLRSEMLLDSLTGLPNRLAFGEAIEAAIAADEGQESFAILAIDLIRFSRINECVGATAGDELIITVARRLVSALRTGDMLARMAGDEFGVLLRLTDGPGDALHAARRLIATLLPPIRLSELEIRIDCAIGCALWSERAPTSSDLLRNAQVALKRAKASGRIEVYQRGEINHARRRLSLETDLRRAIERDELSLAFQPLINLESGAVAGFEALARWDHPDYGPVTPTEFIDVAEDSGLIVPLGRWALDAAARTMARWDETAGRPVPIRMGVNVSAVQLARDEVAQAVAASGIDSSRLTLELTESSIVADPERANRELSALHARGCRVAMDDFGTGYSSLAYLQKLPIDILKIDRSFVTDMHENRDSVAIIRAILSLARTLGMDTTAEGIETVEAAHTLAALGCTTGQGFYFARPLPADEAYAFYRARNT